MSTHHQPQPQPSPSTSTSHLPKHQQDEVIPVFAMDNFKFAQAFTGSYKFVINGSIDVSVLTTALDRLLAMGHWRKMGARIRKNAQGQLEWHIPRPFTPERPAYRLTSATYASPSAAGLHIPAATHDAPSIQPDLGPTRLFLHASTPMTMDEFTDPAHDRPCFNIHVTHFRDGSVACLGITFPHIFCDGIGIAQMLWTWLSLMRDPNAPVPALMGFDKDPFAALEAQYDFSAESPAAAPAAPPGRTKAQEWEDILYEMRLQEEFEKHPKETRTVYLPGAMVQQMRREAIAELRQRKAAGEDVPDFLSENDIVIAWWIKVVFGEPTPEDEKKPLIALVGSSLRKRLPEVFPPNSAYVHNATLAFASAPVPVAAVAHLSVASLAAASRAALLAQQRDRATLQRAVAQKLWSNRVGNAPVAAAAHGTWHFTTTWTDARCLEWDFAPAARGGEIRDGAPGSVRAFSGGLVLNGPFPARGLLTVLARDKDGGYWLQPCLRREDWSSRTMERLRQAGGERVVRARL
ncbi:hypothetical protein GLOTRDRAFT_140191 [Gloeophyllum trabeum ATCC 11539]|uniref:Transferase-domain-containing protein n=1 Tax=Gloeophyllum trabeum (strain ATCC 11539 / FP-39264 / Madison 617) TaxID=670483 RepID=S7PYL7_GLOTA|nr:uncharacterized protein GLOTRDRAFT_140191 [Gloeophyllum trabeum ATCC 11539]EPQ52427.1 hypothetical protein GLOTRDRAFT_140191 [Gloeophyllum trabeum ATCC 11539]